MGESSGWFNAYRKSNQGQLVQQTRYQAGLPPSCFENGWSFKQVAKGLTVPGWNGRLTLSVCDGQTG